jgi:hypothetical protein
MEKNGCVNIFSKNSTSERSNAIIDFAITQDKTGWTCEVINEGTSDHFPVIYRSPFMLSEKGFSRKTNWKMFFILFSRAYGAERVHIYQSYSTDHPGHIF